MRILIIRHADPEYHGDTLTPAGHAEAAALGARLARALEGPVDRLFTSPLGRARDTAAAIAVAAASPPAGIPPRTLTPSVEGWTRELSDWPRLGVGLAGAPGGGGGGRRRAAARPGRGASALVGRARGGVVREWGGRGRGSAGRRLDRAPAGGGSGPAVGRTSPNGDDRGE
eukprot:TRINITY_DN2301_c0_g2_i1.p3 TRINITY_DN2301_c0_g2~~TRINITY_DN2301_c0_g2_i1.p3  ORF type:complete len:190 (+),score=20.68 TRINITY_DN2301_c0_g2_i1:59-571(+)